LQSCTIGRPVKVDTDILNATIEREEAERQEVTEIVEAIGDNYDEIQSLLISHGYIQRGEF